MGIWQNPFVRWLTYAFAGALLFSFPTYHFKTVWFITPFLVCLFFGLLSMHMMLSTLEGWAENKFQVSLRKDWRTMFPLIPAYLCFALGFSIGIVGAFALNASSYWAFLLFPGTFMIMLGMVFLSTWRSRGIDKGWIKPMDYERSEMERGTP